MANNNAIDTQWKIPVSFYFQVEIGSDGIAFKEVGGLNSEMEVETVQEGGVNEYEHRLPKQIKHGNLVLKRALMPVKDNPIVTWIKSILEGGAFFSGQQDPLARTIKISLLSLKIIKEDNKEVTKKYPLYVWECAQAFPVKWEAEALDAEKNSVLIESVEFVYSTLKRLEV